MFAHAMSNTAPAIADKKIQRDVIWLWGPSRASTSGTSVRNSILVFWGIDIQSRHKGAQTGMGAVQINVRSEASDHTQPVRRAGCRDCSLAQLVVASSRAPRRPTASMVSP